MRDARIARRYARAFLGLAKSREDLEQLSRDLQLLRRVVRESREFVAFLKSPVIKADKKQAALRAIFESRVKPQTMGFLLLIVEKRREETLPRILEEFFSLVDERLGIVAVDVQAATDLPKGYREKIGSEFERLTRKKVRLDVRVDRGLIGGLVARVGDTVFDGSIKRQLELLRSQLEEKESQRI
jgi:F-type H+-transporting ATPase subunit delta